MIDRWLPRPGRPVELWEGHELHDHVEFLAYCGTWPPMGFSRYLGGPVAATPITMTGASASAVNTLESGEHPHVRMVASAQIGRFLRWQDVLAPYWTTTASRSMTFGMLASTPTVRQDRGVAMSVGTESLPMSGYRSGIVYDDVVASPDGDVNLRLGNNSGFGAEVALTVTSANDTDRWESYGVTHIAGNAPNQATYYRTSRSVLVASGALAGSSDTSWGGVQQRMDTRGVLLGGTYEWALTYGQWDGRVAFGWVLDVDRVDAAIGLAMEPWRLVREKRQRFILVPPAAPSGPPPVISPNPYIIRRRASR